MSAQQLSRRERQIMDIIYELKEASAQQVLDKLPEPPAYSTVRALLVRLEDKGVLTHREHGARYIFSPVVEKATETRNALSRIIKTFFDGSPVQATNALLGMSANDLDDKELDELEAIIKAARKQQDKRH